MNPNIMEYEKNGVIPLKPISNRYEIKELIAPLLGGQLYIGKDMSLMRYVFLYEIPVRQGVPIEPYIQKIGKVMQVSTHTQFLHILDVEMAEEQVRIVLTHREGCMFKQYTGRHSMTFQEAVAMIVQFGRVMLDAAEERSMEFSLHPGNIWITDDQKINVINSWDRPAERQRLSKELVALLLQLVSRSSVLPSDGQRVEAEFRKHLNGLPASSREAVISTLTNAWNGRLSLNAFIQNLQHLMQGGAKESAGRGVTPPPERIRRAPVIQEPSPQKKPIEKEREAEQIPDEETEEKPRDRRLYRLSKRLWQGLGLAALTIAVFIGVFTLLIQSTDSKGKQAGSAVTPTPDRQSSKPSDTSKPSPSSSSKTSPTPSKKPSEQPSPSPSPSADPPAQSGGPVSVPNLIGLARDAAEKQALANGLRFEFVIEVNEMAAGNVFKQEPAANETAAKGDRIKFWVSKGPQ
ncbi:hypothetical protein DQG23_13360 [Paenibacillus contaminans]|uniref:PASTA domain-containing protein n=1 Tax=Paenibacillus contaminans TaxID=450362 RepID=A0A329MN65_9BACL|nr:hypothetical protein DQG23_13360 [Paenibacillus contaminans]